MYLFPFLQSSPGIPIPPWMALAHITATTFQQASIDRHLNRLSAWCPVSLVQRSHSFHSARGGIARSSCGESCRQWSLQQCEVVSFRGCGGTRMPPFRECGGASDSADAARTSGSWANRPDLATQCFGRRA